MVNIQCALFGWAHTNIFAVMAEDTLHQDFNGICVHLFACLDAHLDMHKEAQKGLIAQQGQIREALVYMRQLHGTSIPSQGLHTEKMTAEVISSSLLFATTCTDLMYSKT